MSAARIGLLRERIVGKPLPIALVLKCGHSGPSRFRLLLTSLVAVQFLAEE